MRRRFDSLIGQVLAANAVLVVLTMLSATLVAGLRPQGNQLVVLVLAVLLSLVVNMWMLERRFAPLGKLVEEVERVDPARPGEARLARPDEQAAEVGRLARAFERLLESIERERRRSGQLVLRAQEEERRRLARDLHDETNQALTGILLRLEALAFDVPDDLRPRVVELKQLVASAMEELVALARQLRPAALDDHGLVPALEAQLARLSKRSGIAADLAVRGNPDRLSADQQSALYRIAQEAITNAQRHARARRIVVELACEGPSARLTVADDGVGFDPTSEGEKGLGLRGMAERAHLAGGELDVRSAPGGGTAVSVVVPLASGPAGNGRAPSVDFVTERAPATER